MLTMSANEAKTNFGDVLMKSQRTPVQISKYGKPVAMLVSMEDYADAEALKLELLKLRTERAQLQISQGEVSDGEDFFTELMAGKFD